MKVLDIDRERQRISLGLKQTQADLAERHRGLRGGRRGRGPRDQGGHVRRLRGDPPRRRGARPHLGLAAHHVENPREVVNQGDVLAVRIIEIDADRRRLSLSLKRVADSDPIQHRLPDDIRRRPRPRPRRPPSCPMRPRSPRRWTTPSPRRWSRRPSRRSSPRPPSRRPLEEARGGRRRAGDRGGRGRRGRSPRPSASEEIEEAEAEAEVEAEDEEAVAGRRTRRPSPRRRPPRATTPRARRIAGAPVAPRASPSTAASGPASPRRSRPSPRAARRRCRATRWCTTSTATPRSRPPSPSASVRRPGEGAPSTGRPSARGPSPRRAASPTWRGCCTPASSGGGAHGSRSRPGGGRRPRCWSARCRCSSRSAPSARFDAALLVTAPEEVRRRRVEARARTSTPAAPASSRRRRRWPAPTACW